MKEKRGRRSFSQEFKEETIELAKKEGNSKAARELGISESCIRNWRKKQELPGDNSFRKIPKQSYNELEKQVRKLQKENGYLKEINKVLKKSTAIFSAEHVRDLR